MQNKEPLFGKTLSDLQELATTVGLPKFTAKQLTDWLYKKEVSSIDEMTNISKKGRALLSETYTVGLHPPVKEQVSVDGTKKYLYQGDNETFIEAAYIPDADRATLCVSSQAGCKMGCLFCMTGKQGFQGQLSSGEILNQVKSLPEFQQLTNLVYMGMGEPFDNLDEVLKSLEVMTSDYGFGWSPSRITVSTIGIIPAIRTFLEKTRCHLAVSLHTPFDDERSNLMPVQQAYPIAEVIDALREHTFTQHRRISFEYILFDGINDTLRHVSALARLLDGLRCRINLIRFHSIPDVPLKGTPIEQVELFKERLNDKGILTTIRKSRGKIFLPPAGCCRPKSW